MSELRLSIKQLNVSASQATVREHKVTIDRPTEKDGNNQGPMGGELFLIGLGGCFMSNLLAAIKARNINITDVNIDITSKVAGSPLKFTEIDFQISALYENKTEFEKLVVIAERSCIVANSIKDFIPITITIK